MSYGNEQTVSRHVLFSCKFSVASLLNPSSSWRILLSCRVALHNRRLVAAWSVAVCEGVHRVSWRSCWLAGHVHGSCMLGGCEGKHRMLCQHVFAVAVKQLPGAPEDPQTDLRHTDAKQGDKVAGRDRTVSRRLQSSAQMQQSQHCCRSAVRLSNTYTECTSKRRRMSRAAQAWEQCPEQICSGS